MVKAFGKTAAVPILIGLSLVLAVFLSTSGCNRDQSSPPESTTTTAAAPAATVPVPTTLAPSPSTAPPPTTTVPPAPAKTATTPETTTTTSPATVTTLPATKPAAPPTTTVPAATSTDPGNHSRVQVGMTTQQVQELMGSPGKAKQKKNGMLEWEYYTGQGKFEVYFQNDRVVSSRMH